MTQQQEIPENVQQRPSDVGVAMMADLIKSIVIANENAARTQQLLEVLITKLEALTEAVDSLVGFGEVAAGAADLVVEIAQNKKHVGAADVAAAIASSNEEVFGDSDDDGLDGDDED